MITPVVNDILTEIARDYTDHMFNNGQLWTVEDGFAMRAVTDTYTECKARGWSDHMAIIETSRLHHSTFHLPNWSGKAWF